MTDEELQGRTKQFAHRCVKVAVALPGTDLGRHIRRQLMRCSTSVAANYRAACLAQSKASFVSKLSTVLEETDESHFWLEFIVDESLMARRLVSPLLEEAGELRAIFLSSRMTATGKKRGNRSAN